MKQIQFTDTYLGQEVTEHPDVWIWLTEEEQTKTLFAAANMTPTRSNGNTKCQ